MSTPGYPAVSGDVVNELFGERSPHARAMIGVAALAFGVPSIIEATIGV